MPFFSIKLYDKEDNPAEYSRSFLPMKVLRRAIRLSKHFEGKASETFTEADIDELEAFVVDAFGGKFTKDQLDEGADVGEMMSCLNQIIAMASQAANPTPPASL